MAELVEEITKAFETDPEIDELGMVSAVMGYFRIIIYSYIISILTENFCFFEGNIR
jgi:hypothetical protein